MDFSFSFKKPSGQKPAPQVNPFEAAEGQFNAIRGCGVTPRPKVTFKQLTEGQDPASFDQAPFAYMLCLMGGTDAEGEPLSDDVWLCNLQCIAEEGHYSYVVSQLMRIAKGALPLEELADALDAENAQATIQFNLDSETVQWVVAVEEGMIAGEVLSGLAAIAAERGDGARFAWADVDGQRLIVFLNEQELGELVEATGMEWGYIE